MPETGGPGHCCAGRHQSPHGKEIKVIPELEGAGIALGHYGYIAMAFIGFFRYRKNQLDRQVLLTPIITAVLVLSALSSVLTLLLLVAEFFFANYGECTIDVNQGEKVSRLRAAPVCSPHLRSETVFAWAVVAVVAAAPANVACSKAPGPPASDRGALSQ